MFRNYYATRAGNTQIPVKAYCASYIEIEKVDGSERNLYNVKPFVS